jgi:hypothetical protein
MASHLNTTGIIVIIIILLLLIYIAKNNILDSFVVFLQEKVIPPNCYNYLLTDNKKYYLLDTHRIYDDANPLIFNNKEEAVNFLKTSNCEPNIPFVNLVQKKNKNDPTVTIDRECNKHVAPHLFDIDVCNTYGNDLDQSSANMFAKINKIETDKAQYSNYDTETCMIDSVIKANPDLDDTHFKDNFAKYFNRMNDNIDKQFLYVTSN